MALIDFYIRNQKLSKNGPEIIAGSIKYVDCSFTFKTKDWEGLDKWLILEKGEEVYRVNLLNDEIPKETGLNIGEGLWHASLFGEGADGTRITTDYVTISVDKSAVSEGEALPAIEQTEAEQIAAKAQRALDAANEVKAAAEAGEFNGKNGTDGKDGYSPKVEVEEFYNDQTKRYGVTIKVHQKEGLINAASVFDGKDGEKGEPGYTPKRGTDYWTEEDKEEIVREASEGVEIGKQGPQGEKGEDGTPGANGERGSKILKITTASTSYTTTVGGFKPSYRWPLANVLSESGSEDVKPGDVLWRSYYHYAIGYVDANYVYAGAYVNFRGATGSKGEAGTNGADGQGIFYAMYIANPNAGDGYEHVPIGAITVPDGRTVKEGDFIITHNGDYLKIEEVTSSEAKSTYLYNVIGEDGLDGSSVFVSSVSESTADGGSNVVTFSDGKKITIKNGTKGSDGAPGPQGEKGEDGFSPTIETGWNEDGTVLTIGKKDGSFEQVTIRDGKDGENGSSVTAQISEIDGGHRVTVSDIAGPKSFDVLDGKDGKTAFQYAVEGGFEGTEAEFAEMIAADPREFVFNVTGNQTDGYTSDKTYAEVFTALTDGRTVKCQFFGETVQGAITPMFGFENGVPIFLGSVSATTFWMIAFLPEGIEVQEISSGISINGQRWDGMEPADFTGTINDMIAAKIPTALKNPKKLNFSGAVSGSYDGSAEVNIEVPAIAGEKGEDGERGTGILAITTAPSSYTTAAGGFTPKYRIALSTVLSQANVTKVLVGDTLKYSYYTYPVGYVDESYVYLGTRDSIRGAAGAAGTAGKDGKGMEWLHTPQDYGAACDGVTDDTAAFNNALKANRRVFVPGGTYLLSDTIFIWENCELELSQDTVLNFTQTGGDCVVMYNSASLMGNHATVSVPYTFDGHVICVDTNYDEITKEGETRVSHHGNVEPFTRNTPVWRSGRYLKNLNIVKPNAEGFHRSNDGTCYGTAVYLCADATALFTCIWGVDFSGLRICGGFSYGIRAANVSTGWNHEMRIEGITEACEVGVSLENCNNAYVAVTVQPNSPMCGNDYAKWGIRLQDSKNADLSGSRVWDWQHSVDGDVSAAETEYTHIAMYGQCRGLILNDFRYYEVGENVRDTIYTDTPSNLENMVIIQEPITRWFKTIGGVPYFNDGTANKKLMLATEKFLAEQADFILSADGEYITTPEFTNLVTAAGYTDGSYMGNGGGVASGDSTLTLTGYIPVKTGAKIIRIAGTGVSFGSYGCVIAFFDANKNLLGAYPYNRLNEGGGWGTTVADENSAVAWNSAGSTHGCNGVYMRISAKGKGANLIVTVDEELTYKNEWHGEPKRMDESIYAQNVFLKSPDGTGYKITVNNSGALLAEKAE